MSKDEGMSYGWWLGNTDGLSMFDQKEDCLAMMNECRQDDDSATIKVYQMDAGKDDCLVFIKEYHLDDNLAMMKAHQIDAPKDDCL